MSTRVRNLPNAPVDPLAILFSGGLDCALLVYYAHLTLPKDTPIDLLNVAFQNPRIHGMTVQDPYSTCPDRITGISAYHELQTNCPGRTFRLVCINTPFTETTEHKPTILGLMSPHNTEMDLSIASALYFASRGIGLIYPTTTQYRTPARVLISGLGADELFAGYNRHQIAFSRNGYTALLSELQLDASRLGKRNLGRDDRVTAHWAREVRYPFLDERVVNWAMSVPVWFKCAFGVRSAPGLYDQLPKDKAVLRGIAWDKGLKSIAQEKKRAVRITTV
jgi:asparagine synthetase B (glutamine-hydrolysing)